MNNYKIAYFFSQILIFGIEKNPRDSLIFEFGQFQKFPICKIPKISDTQNSKNFQFRQVQKFPIWKIPKIFNLENFKNF